MRKLFIETCHDCFHLQTRERSNQKGFAEVLNQSFSEWSVFDPAIGETIGAIIKYEEYCRKTFRAIEGVKIPDDCPLEKMTESEIIIYNLEKEIKKDEESDETNTQTGP